MAQNNPRFLDHLITSNEAISDSNSEVNMHNVVWYAPCGQGHPADHYAEHQQGTQSVHVWAGLLKNWTVLGLYFIRGNLDTREYIKNIGYYVIQRDFRRHNIDRNAMW